MTVIIGKDTIIAGYTIKERIISHLSNNGDISIEKAEKLFKAARLAGLAGGKLAFEKALSLIIRNLNISYADVAEDIRNYELTGPNS
jgi:hypothetical protein